MQGNSSCNLNVRYPHNVEKYLEGGKVITVVALSKASSIFCHSTKLLVGSSPRRAWKYVCPVLPSMFVLTEALELADPPSVEF